MPFQLIFGGDVEERSKDIIFFTSYPGLVLPVVHLSVDSPLVPSCANLFAVRN